MQKIKSKIAALAATIKLKFTRAVKIVVNPQEPTLDVPVINSRGESTFQSPQLNRQERRAAKKSLRKKGR